MRELILSFMFFLSACKSQPVAENPPERGLSKATETVSTPLCVYGRISSKKGELRAGGKKLATTQLGLAACLAGVTPGTELQIAWTAQKGILGNLRAATDSSMDQRILACLRGKFEAAKVRTQSLTQGEIHLLVESEPGCPNRSGYWRWNRGSEGPAETPTLYQ